MNFEKSANRSDSVIPTLLLSTPAKDMSYPKIIDIRDIEELPDAANQLVLPTINDVGGQTTLPLLTNEDLFRSIKTFRRRDINDDQKWELCYRPIRNNYRSGIINKIRIRNRISK